MLTIIPAAGRGSRMLQLTDNCAKSMVPIAGRPLISYLLDQLVEQQLKDVVIVVGYQKDMIIDYVDKFYSNKLNITYVEQKDLLGLGYAIYEVVNQVPITEDVFIMLGDAIFNTDKIYTFDSSYIACKEMTDYSRWCIAVQENGKLVELLDKPQIKPKNNLALVGAYYFKNGDLFKDSVIKAIQSGVTIRGEYQLSTAIELYNKKEQISILELKDGEWLDFGELNTYNANKKKINQSRFFNKIEYKDNAVIKTSDSNKHKIQKEAIWYLTLPNNLKKYTPELKDYNLDDSNPSYTIEYCEGNTLQEMWLYSNFNTEMWTKILNKVMLVMDDFKKSSNEYTISLYDFIKKQLDSRVDLETFFNKQKYINDKMYDLDSLGDFFNLYLENAKERFTNSNSYICHGDMVFSNIIYDTLTDNIKLIDPRGDFCGNIMYGDIRYDIAKLAQCIVGDYDYIVNNLFTLENEYTPEENYKLYLDKPESLKKELFDLITKDYNKDDIIFLTAVQFMTMIPLHSENLNHMIMMKDKAIELLGYLRDKYLQNN